MPFSRLRSTKPLSSLGAVDADVEVAVGGQQDAIHALLAERCLGQLVGELDAFGARRGTARRAASRSAARIFSFSLTGVGGSTSARGARVDHDGHGVGAASGCRQQQLHRLH